MPDYSESRLTIDGSSVRARLSIDLLLFAGVDDNRDGRVSDDELDGALEEVFAEIKRVYQVRADGDPVRVVMHRYQVRDEHVLGADLDFLFAGPVTSLEVTSAIDRIAGPAHEHLVAVTLDGELHRAVLDRSRTTASFVAGGVPFTRVLITLVAAVGLACLVWYRRRARPGAP